MAGSNDRPVSTDFSREVLDLFDAYVHGALDRRGFLEKCTVQAGSLAAAHAAGRAQPRFRLWTGDRTR